MNDLSTLEKILAETAFYTNPDLLMEKAKEGIDFDSIDKKLLQRYKDLLTNIKWAHEKVLRYPLYFREFYPASGEIPDHEALEHHIHSYIEDMNILRNKICHFLGSLKNDLKKVAANKDEIDSALKFLDGQVRDVFQNVSDTRNPHNHAGNRFKDADLVDVELAQMSLDDDFPLKSQFKSEFLEELKKTEVESFEKAKVKWIERAEKNNEQTSGLVEDVMDRNIDFIYKLLNIKPLEF